MPEDIQGVSLPQRMWKEFVQLLFCWKAEKKDTLNDFLF